MAISAGYQADACHGGTRLPQAFSAYLTGFCFPGVLQFSGTDLLTIAMFDSKKDQYETGPQINSILVWKYKAG